jgi:hypothetical protein
MRVKSLRTRFTNLYTWVVGIFLLAFFSVGVIACAQSKTNHSVFADNTTKRPDFVFYLYSYCDYIDKSRGTPVLAEEESFELRLSTNKGRIAQSLLPICILNEFGETETKYWASKGDPVAQYVTAYLLYEENGCKSFDDVKALLIRSMSVKTARTINDRGGFAHPLLRVPESGMVLSALAKACLSPEESAQYETYEFLAFEGGYAFRIILSKQ